MITEHDLQEAIAECEGERNPNANTCLKLAAFYTIKQHMYPDDKSKEATQQHIVEPQYSYATGNKVEYESNTEFSKLTRYMNINDLMPIMDELMTTIQILNPRLYNGVMRKIVDN